MACDEQFWFFSSERPLSKRKSYILFQFFQLVSSPVKQIQTASKRGNEDFFWLIVSFFSLSLNYEQSKISNSLLWGFTLDDYFSSKKFLFSFTKEFFFTIENLSAKINEWLHQKPQCLSFMKTGLPILTRFSRKSSKITKFSFLQENQLISKSQCCFNWNGVFHIFPLFKPHISHKNLSSFSLFLHLQDNFRTKKITVRKSLELFASQASFIKSIKVKDDL